MEILNSNTDFTNHSTSSSFYSPDTHTNTNNLNTDDNEHDDLILDDLDLSLLSDSSLTYNTNSYNNCGSSNNDGSESSYSPDSKTADDLIDEDPFLIALKQHDEQNSKSILNNEFKNIDNNNLFKHNLSQNIAQQPPRKIIKINSIPNKSCLSNFLTNDTNNKLIKSSQPMVKVVSVTNNTNSDNKLKSSSSSSDLLSLINYRNNAKPIIPLANNNINATLQMKQSQNPSQSTTTTTRVSSNQALNKNSLPLTKSTNNSSIKVINLSQITKQQQHQQPKINTSNNLLTNNTNKLNQQIIQIGSLNNLTSANNIEMNSNGELTPPTPTTTTTSINGVKITKVVSSRNQTTDNLVYIRKNSNQLVALKTPTCTSVINANALQSCKQLTSPYNKITSVNNVDRLKQPGASFRYIVNNNNNNYFNSTNTANNPNQTKLDNKFSNTKEFTSYYLNNNNNNNNNNISNNNNNKSSLILNNQPVTQSNNLHLNLLNSNLNRIASINNMSASQSVLNDSFNNNNIANSILNPIHSDFVNNFSTTTSTTTTITNNINNNNNISNNNHFYLNHYEPDEEVAIEEEEELGHAETYANYMPSKCNYF